MPFTCNKKRDLGVSDFTKWKAQIMTPANSTQQSRLNYNPCKDRFLYTDN